MYLKQQLTGLAVLPSCFHRDFDKSPEQQEQEGQEGSGKPSKKPRLTSASGPSKEREEEEDADEDEDASSSEEEGDDLWSELERNKAKKRRTPEKKAATRD